MKEAHYVPVHFTTTTQQQILSTDSTATTATSPNTDDQNDKTSPGEIETTTTKWVEPGPGPVGACPCGATQMKVTGLGMQAEDAQDAQDTEDTEGVHRPWLAHINIEKESGEPVECTGSLLNM